MMMIRYVTGKITEGVGGMCVGFYIRGFPAPETVDLGCGSYQGSCSLRKLFISLIHLRGMTVLKYFRLLVTL